MRERNPTRRASTWPGVRASVMVTLCLLSLLLSACRPASMTLYQGNRPDSEIAIIEEGDIRIMDRRDVWHTRLRGIDGVPMDAREARVLPGTHSVTLDCFTHYDPVNSGSMYQCFVDCFRFARTFVTLEAVAGGRYVVSCKGPRIGASGDLRVVVEQLPGGARTPQRLCRLSPANWWNSTACRCEGEGCMGATGASSWSGAPPVALPTPSE